MGLESSLLLCRWWRTCDRMRCSTEGTSEMISPGGDYYESLHGCGVPESLHTVAVFLGSPVCIFTDVFPDLFIVMKNTSFSFCILNSIKVFEN